MPRPTSAPRSSRAPKKASPKQRTGTAQPRRTKAANAQSRTAQDRTQQDRTQKGRTPRSGKPVSKRPEAAIHRSAKPELATQPRAQAVSQGTASQEAVSRDTKADAPAVRFIEIDTESSGQRIDNFLLRELKGAPRSLIYNLLRKGEVRVNKKRIKAPYKLEAGDLVRIAPVRLGDSKEPVPVSNQLADNLAQAILHEDDELLIINKPSGLAVHGGSGVNLGLIEALRQLRPDARFLELVHRLDRETSGCVMIAKKRSALRKLHEDLRHDRIHKIYHALVEGRWPNRKNKVDVPLRKNDLQSGERMVRVSQDGKEALTQFRILQRYTDMTLVEAKPITGRTHQIRVHCQFAGHPIIGDDKYGEDAVNKAARDKGIRRLFLHAHELRLRHPKTGKPLSVHAPMDERLTQGLAGLEKSD